MHSISSQWAINVLLKPPSSFIASQYFAHGNRFCARGYQQDNGEQRYSFGE